MLRKLGSQEKKKKIESKLAAKSCLNKELDFLVTTLVPSLNTFAELSLFAFCTQLTPDKYYLGLITNFYIFITYDILFSLL